LTLAVSEAALASFGDGLRADGVVLQVVADGAAALTAVRAETANAALFYAAGGAELSGLSVRTVPGGPVYALVPFTFPVEGITSVQARALAGGSLRSWSEAGGPELAVRTAIQDVAAVSSATGGPAQAMAGIPADLAALDQRGAILFTSESNGGPLSKRLRIDGLLPGEPEYPLDTRWSLAVRATDRGLEQRIHLPDPTARASEAEIVLDATGDIMLGRDVGRQVAAQGARYPFEAVAPLLAGSDIRFGNLELPLTERGQAARKDYVFRAPPSSVEGLSAAGFNVLSFANNHAVDYGTEGLLDTLDTLARAGILQTGAGRNAAEAHAPAIMTVKGLRVAFLAYVNTPNDGVSGWQARGMEAGASKAGVAWGTADGVRRDVVAARAHADLVIVAVHAGAEYLTQVNAVQRELAYAAVDAGAVLVLGAHPHVLQGIEVYKRVPIVYSLGNFIFDFDDDDRRQPGLPSALSGVLRLRLGREGVRSLEFRPAVIDQRQLRPLPVSGVQARPVYERLYSLTDALNPVRGR